MKRITPLYMMLFFALSAVWTSVQNYKITQREIANQLTEALLLTKTENPQDWFSPDTIRQFRQHIRQPELREASGLAFYNLGDKQEGEGLCSRELDISPSLRARGYVHYSSFEVWRMSDQRLSFVFTMMTLLWMACSLRKRRWETYTTEATTLQDTGTEISLPYHLTPMQEQLMDMFLSSPDGELTKQEICDKLWPGKPDASETLYALIRRTKQALQESTDYRIESNRGRSYLLTRI